MKDYIMTGDKREQVGMRVAITGGGSGVACWNGDALAKAAEEDTLRAMEVLGASPDTAYHAGVISCRGCLPAEDGSAICTATLNRSLYSRIGTRPSTVDLLGDVNTIEGFVAVNPSPDKLEGTDFSSRAA